MKKILTFCVALMAAISLSAENYFIKSTWGEAEASWKQMIEDDGAFILSDVFIDGKDLLINTVAEDEGARTVKPENITAFIGEAWENIELAAGDVVFLSFDPEEVSAYDPKQTGFVAIIQSKGGCAIKIKNAWKNMIADDGTFVLYNEFFDGKDVSLATGSEIRSIKIENINSMLNFEAAPIAAGDSVMFVYDPDSYNAYDESESGLLAMINFKKGAIMKVDNVWTEMIVDPEDEDWLTLENITFDGNAVQLAHRKNINEIQPENIKAYINYDDAELSAGDHVVFIFRPSLVNQFNEKESGLNALITFKNGYALKSTWGEKTASWKNLVKQDEDTYTLENVLFDGGDVVILNGSDIRTIKAENIAAMLLPNYDDAELEAGDLVVFMYTPSEYASMDPSKPGLFALIAEKHGYALKSDFGEGVAWKAMEKTEEDTYIIENVIFDGNDVLINNLASDEGARTIKVENIKAYLLPSYEEAELEAGDLIVFMYTPSDYASMDPSKPGLSALIVEKKQGTGIDNTAVEAKAVKMIRNGQLFIIRDGKMFNAAGVVVK